MPNPDDKSPTRRVASVPIWPMIFDPPAGYTGAHHVLRISTPMRSPDGPPEPLAHLVGPFPTAMEASAWGSDRANNPTDNPHWHVVAVSGRSSSMPYFLPDQAAPPRQPTDPSDHPSPGPWIADRLHQTECGAVRILDNRGNTIGWATDTMGHTLDPAVPAGIHRNDIALNADLMAMGQDAIMLCRLIREAFPKYRQQQWAASAFVDLEFEKAFDMAGGMLRRAGGLHDAP